MNTYKVKKGNDEFTVMADRTSIGDPMIPNGTIIFYIGDEAVAMFTYVSSCIKQTA